MNKIKLVNNIVVEKKVNKKIIVTSCEVHNLLDVHNLVFEILEDTSLELEFETQVETKLSITFKIKPQVKFTLFERRVGEKSKNQYQFYIAEDSQVDVTKFNHIRGCKELDVFYLEGQNATINYNFKTISTTKEKYDLMIYHNASNTNSYIKNSGVNVEKGSLIFNVSSFVPNGCIDCQVDQIGKIINLGNEKCQINPNLLIDENDVNANHSAHISKFSPEEMFYLQSRGLSYNQALNLLIRGFLLEGINSKEITKIIDRYWR